MNLLACLQPQTPPKPENARVIRFGIAEPITSEARRKASNDYYKRNAPRLRLEQRGRDRAK